MKLYIYSPHADDFMLVCNEEAMDWMKAHNSPRTKEELVPLMNIYEKLLVDIQNAIKPELGLTGMMDKIIQHHKLPTLEPRIDYYWGDEVGGDDSYIFGITLTNEVVDRWQCVALIAILEDYLEWEFVRNPYGSEGAPWSDYVCD